MKKKAFIVILAAILVVGVGTAGTLAWLTDTKSVTNTFTIGQVKLDLYETDAENGHIYANTYTMIPGTTNIKKDPTVTVLANSEDCYLFVEMIEPAPRTVGTGTELVPFSDIVDYEFAPTVEGSDWFKYDVTGRTVYYRVVSKADTDRSFGLIDGGTISIKGTATNEMIKAFEDATLEFKAYAIQQANAGTVADAWSKLTTP